MILHASRSLEYRNPFGAQPTEGNVVLTFDAPVDAQNVTLCYTYGLYGMTYHEEPMCLKDKKTDHSRYSVSLMLPHEPGLLFYWFRFALNVYSPDFPHEFDEQAEFIDDMGNAAFYYVAEADTPKGEGKIYYEPPRVGADEDKYPYAYQITVYERGFVTPDAIKGALIYQIFPDRFARDKNFKFDVLTSISDREERIYHKDWDEDVDIVGKPSTGYLACDFFGGSLDGIAEKMDYIKSLGIDIIYLNPIFEARSSHRYDTADYLQVDPILGGNKAFDNLVKTANEKGIKLILDGVFSHTGADSRYFNKFDRFPGVGAYASYRDTKESPYRSWYNFYRSEEGEITYDSWWGFPDLPNVDENNLSYRNFIFGKDGVVDTWTSRGASGIRLDVSDELPDSFIRQMRSTLKKCTNGEGILVGEVWEDASNKCSYGSYRDFLLGRTHDSVMGYTFRKIMLEYLCGYISSEVCDSRLEGYRERYPDQAYYSIMNLISSHDVPRFYTMLSMPEDYEDRAMQQTLEVPEDKKEMCARLARMAFAIQVGYIGAGCLYYGDEILMQGYKDPFNRRTYPWGKLDSLQQEELDNVRDIAKLRVEHPVLKTGEYRTVLAQGDSFVMERYLNKGNLDHFGNEVKCGSKSILLICNRSDKTKFYQVDAGTTVKCKEIAGRGVKPAVGNSISQTDKTAKYGIGPWGFLFVIL